MNIDYAPTTSMPELRQTLAAVERALEGWLGRGEFDQGVLAEILCDLVALKSLDNAGNGVEFESRSCAPKPDIQLQ